MPETVWLIQLPRKITLIQVILESQLLVLLLLKDQAAVTVQKVTALAITLIVVIGQVEETLILHHSIQETPTDPEVQEARRVQADLTFAKVVSRRLTRRNQIRDRKVNSFKSLKLTS